MNNKCLYNCNVFICLYFSSNYNFSTFTTIKKL